MIDRLPLLFIMLFLTVNISYAQEYYVDLSGSDSNSGSSTSPWATIQTSINKLTPGDILNIADGKYSENVKPLVSGTSSAPILIRATNSFGVTIDAGGVASALNLEGVSYLSFEGFKLQNSGDRSVLRVNSRDGVQIATATGNGETHHIALRKISIKGSCLNKNCTAALIGRSNDILMEDAWVYGAGRYTLSVYGSRDITVRRVVIRWDQWYGASYKPNDPRNAMGIYNTHDSLFENIIILDAGQRPPGTSGDKGALLLAGGDNGKTSTFVNSSNNEFYGLTLYNNVGLAISLSARAQPHNNNTFENGVIYSNSIRAATINKRVTNTTYNHMTFVDHPKEGYANWSNETSGNKITNSIIANNGSYAFRGEKTESYNIVFGNSPNYPSGSTPGTGSLVIDPELEYVFKNDTKPLNDNLASDGKPRGANLLYRYINGVESTQKLWPWLYEDQIHQDFCAPSALTEFGRVGDNSAGWCDSGKSLTRYLWESYGKAAALCPAEICDFSPDPLINVEAVEAVESVESVEAVGTPTETSSTGGGSIAGSLLYLFLAIMMMRLLYYNVRKNDDFIPNRL